MLDGTLISPTTGAGFLTEPGRKRGENAEKLTRFPNFSLSAFQRFLKVSDFQRFSVFLMISPPTTNC
jgi:hypothetical protein